MQKHDIKIAIYNFRNICRVCLAENGDLESIYNVNLQNEQLDLVKIFKKYCNVEVSPDDNKPQRICEACIKLLCQSYSFFERFSWSNSVLDGVLQENNVTPSEIKDLDSKDGLQEILVNSRKTGNKKQKSYFSDSDDFFLENDNDNDSDWVPPKQILSTSESTVKVECAPDYTYLKKGEESLKKERKSEKKITRKRKAPESIRTRHSKRGRPSKKLEHAEEDDNDSDNVSQKSNELECKICKKHLPDINGAIEHYEENHEQQMEKLECILCEKTRGYKKKDTLLYHMGLHSKDSYKCIPCRQYFKNENFFEDHLQECVKISEKKSNIRSEESENENNLKPDISKNPGNTTKLPQKILNETQFDGAFFCQLCDKKLGEIDMVIEHYERDHLNDLRCIICLRTFTKSVPLFHLGLHSKKSNVCRPCRLFFKTKTEYDSHYAKYDHDKSLACRICGKKFSRNYKKNKHMLSHLKEKNYSCNKCGKTFTYKTSLVRHFKMHFGKRFLCSSCGNAYTTKFMLQRHFNIMHKNVDADGKPLPKPPPKPVHLQCEFCGEIFTTKYGYGRHIRRHPEFNQYKCKICSFQCDNKDQLEKHMEERHNKHTCEVCGKRFPFESELKTHFRKHEDMELSRFRCEVCGKTARTQTQLKVHLRIHTGERPFSCDICGKSFKQTAHLKVHMYQHTGKMPYKCEICEKTFPFQHIMEIHMRTHTGEKPFQCMFCGNAYHDRTTMQKHQKKKHPEMPLPKSNRSEYKMTKLL